MSPPSVADRRGRPDTGNGATRGQGILADAGGAVEDPGSAGGGDHGDHGQIALRPAVGRQPGLDDRAPVGLGDGLGASAISPIRRRRSTGSVTSASSFAPNSKTSASAPSRGVSTSRWNARSTRVWKSVGRSTPLLICAATTDPAEVPNRNSASVTSTPASARPASTPVAQGIPATPPPPRTSAPSFFISTSARESTGMRVCPLRVRLVSCPSTA